MTRDADKAERYMRHLEPLRGPLECYCRRSLRDSDGVADVLQNAVANTFRDFDLYVEGTNFRAWIFRYVHLEILNWNRRFARSRGEAGGDPAEQGATGSAAGLSAEETWELVLDEPLLRVLLADPEAVLEECDELLAAALRDLPAKERSILLLRAIGEFSYREIAEILQAPMGTVMSGLARCRTRLRGRLVGYGRDRGLLKTEAG